MSATLTDRITVRLADGQGLAPQDEQDEPHQHRGLDHEAREARRQVRAAAGPGALATHVVPYGLAYPVKKVRSERKIVRDDHGHPGEPGPVGAAGWASPRGAAP